jgi:hypothetical protein
MRKRLSHWGAKSGQDMSLNGEIRKVMKEEAGAYGGRRSLLNLWDRIAYAQLALWQGGKEAFGARL